MFSRIRTALGLAFALALLTAMTAFAKGGFAFIIVTGADLKGEIRLSDPALTQGFFTFADLFRNKTAVPADPGVGYEITRYYVNGNRTTAFDRVHYYPETGFVYYDGIVNGSSDYDGEWYAAVPEIKSTFETALNTELRLRALGDPAVTEEVARSVEQAQAAHETQPVTPTAPSPQGLTLALLAVGFAVVLGMHLWFRKSTLDQHPKGG